MIILMEVEVLLKRLKDLSSHHGAGATETDMNQSSHGNLKFHQTTPCVLLFHTSYAIDEQVLRPV
jgi:hypothetical protein